MTESFRSSRIAEATTRKLQRLHQVARYASGLPSRPPEFCIVGTQKGGTSSLHAYLAQHPQVAPPVRKEVHFFEDPRNRARGHRWYRSYFPTKPYVRLLERRLGATVITGEATPYMAYPRVPQQLHAVNPDTKLIFLLRNPVDRAFSHYMHVRRSYPGLETLTFSEAIRSEAERIQPELEAGARDEWYDDLPFRAFNYVYRGMYAEQLKRWLTYFDERNIYVDESERFFAQPDVALRGICDFLGLNDHEFDFSEKFNVGHYDDRISPDDRAYLVQAFTDDRAELQRMYGADFGASWF